MSENQGKLGSTELHGASGLWLSLPQKTIVWVFSHGTVFLGLSYHYIVMDCACRILRR